MYARKNTKNQEKSKKKEENRSFPPSKEHIFFCNYFNPLFNHSMYAATSSLKL